MLNFDVTIIGSGLAGLSTALKIAETKRVAIISKRQLIDSSSQWAQGGIASAIPEGSLEGHVHDTLISGAGLCDEDVTKLSPDKKDPSSQIRIPTVTKTSRRRQAMASEAPEQRIEALFRTIDFGTELLN